MEIEEYKTLLDTEIRSLSSIPLKEVQLFVDIIADRETVHLPYHYIGHRKSWPDSAHSGYYIQFYRYSFILLASDRGAAWRLGSDVSGRYTDSLFQFG